MYGTRFLGELARGQLEAVRRDPRLDRADRRAVVAEFWDGLWEIHANQMLARGGMYRLREEVDREACRQGLNVDESGPLNADLQAAWERAQMAAAIVDSDFPWLNGQGVAAHVFALDTLVEDLAPKAQEMVTAQLASRAIEAARIREPALAAEVEEVHGAGLWEPLRVALASALREKLGKPPAPREVGSGRYEEALKKAGLRKRVDDLPVGLEQALAEAHVIRNVIAHRGGWVDERALEKCPSLRWQNGQLLRLSTHDYRRYSAAIRSFGEEIMSRLGYGPVELEGWEDNYLLGI